MGCSPISKVEARASSPTNACLLAWSTSGVQSTHCNIRVIAAWTAPGGLGRFPRSEYSTIVSRFHMSLHTKAPREIGGVASMRLYPRPTVMRDIYFVDIARAMLKHSHLFFTRLTRCVACGYQLESNPKTDQDLQSGQVVTTEQQREAEETVDTTRCEHGCDTCSLAKLALETTDFQDPSALTARHLETPRRPRRSANTSIVSEARFLLCDYCQFRGHCRIYIAGAAAAPANQDLQI